MKIGFLGLGNLGAAMAKRLVQQGERLTVWNRTARKAEGLDASVASSPAAVMDGSDVIILNLFDSAAVKQVLQMPDGLLHGNCRGKTVVDTTTNHPSAVGEFHTILASNGGHYLEAPVLGSVVPASQGTLTMLVSGEERVLETARPLLQKMCKEIFFLGGPCMATRMKLVNNFVLASFMTAIAEAGSVGEKAGMPLPAVLTILASGAGNSGVLNAKREKLVKKEFSPHFSVAAIAKDLACLNDLLDEIGVRSTALPLLRRTYEEAAGAGWSGDDFSAVYKLYEERTDR